MLYLPPYVCVFIYVCIYIYIHVYTYTQSLRRISSHGTDPSTLVPGIVKWQPCALDFTMESYMQTKTYVPGLWPSYIHMRMHICVYICICTCACVHICICIHMYLAFMYMCICMQFLYVYVSLKLSPDSFSLYPRFGNMSYIYLDAGFIQMLKAKRRISGHIFDLDSAHLTWNLKGGSFEESSSLHKGPSVRFHVCFGREHCLLNVSCCSHDCPWP